MPSAFERPVGSRADVKELEYISALHQTRVTGTRRSGTVNLLDVSRYLRSRFGLVVDNDQALDVIRGLGGGPLPPRVRDRLAAEKLSQARDRLHAELSAILLAMDERQQRYGGAGNSSSSNNRSNINGGSGLVQSTAGGTTSWLTPATPTTRDATGGSATSSSWAAVASNNRRRAADIAHRNRVLNLMQTMEDMAVVTVGSIRSIRGDRKSDEEDDDDDDRDGGDDDGGDVTQNNVPSDGYIVYDHLKDALSASGSASMDRDGASPPTMMESTNGPTPPPMMGSTNGPAPPPMATHSFSLGNSYKTTHISRLRAEVAAIEKALADLHDLIEEMQRPRMEYLDIVQLVSILMIPTLARCAKQWQEGKSATYYQSETQRVKERLRATRATDSSSVPIEAQASGPTTISADAGGGGGGDDTVRSNHDHEDPINNKINNNTSADQGDRGVEVVAMKELRMLKGKGEKQWAKLTMHTEEKELSLDPQPDHLLEFVLHKLWTMAAEEELEEHDDVGEGPSPSYSSSPWGGSPPRVTNQLVVSLLVACGDHERAQNDRLVQAMVDVAKSPSGRLDELAFVNALTSDLKAWVPGVEDRESTYVFDVFGTEGIGTFHRLGGGIGNNPSKHGKPDGGKADKNDSNSQGDARLGDTFNDPKKNGEEIVDLPYPLSEISEDPIDDLTGVQDSDGPQELGNSMDVPNKNENDGDEDLERPSLPNETWPSDEVTIQKVKAATVIDYVIDSSGSLIVLILIWILFLTQSFAYSSLIFSTDAFTVTCAELDMPDGSFSCILVQTILSWLTVAILLVAFGIVGACHRHLIYAVDDPWLHATYSRFLFLSRRSARPSEYRKPPHRPTTSKTARVGIRYCSRDIVSDEP
jgi:hypothetical protein